MRLHENFEWDPRKAKANARKHQGVTFEDAQAVLGDADGDRFHDEEYDDANSVIENRHITTGSHPEDRRVVLRICWTDRSTGSKRITRIISARLATRKERLDHGKKIRFR